MNSETWLDKATRLQRAVRRPGEVDEERAARERIELALWLKREFSEEHTDGAAKVLPFAAGAQE